MWGKLLLLDVQKNNFRISSLIGAGVEVEGGAIDRGAWGEGDRWNSLASPPVSMSYEV